MSRATDSAPPLPQPRGPLTELLLAGLAEAPRPAFADAEIPAGQADPLADDDLQLALYLCYELHYRGLSGVDAGWEWEPSLIGLRAELERRFLAALAEDVGPEPDVGDSLGAAIFAMVAEHEGPSLSRFLQNRASVEQFREFVMHRSAYQLKEADPHSFSIPRIAGAPKASLLEVQFDEYGGGDPERMHATLFAKTMRALGLDPSYGAYVGRLPGETLATVNLMSLFGLHRRWRGAIVGHLAAFEISSSIPNRRYANGLRRLGFDIDATDFFDEHVEADSVHENVAAYDLAEGLARMEPGLEEDILFGVRALLCLDDRFVRLLLDCWDRGESSLLGETAPVAI